MSITFHYLFNAYNPHTAHRFVAQFFESDISSGIPVLTDKGREALLGELKEPTSYPLEGQAQESA